MKTKKKALALALCAVLLVVTSVLGTMAYLTDSEQATNTFTVGKVYIELDEADVTTDGTIDTNERVKENEYHLIPGHTYIKDPTVTVNADSENCYVRMLATITYNEAADAVFAKYDTEKDMSAWLDIDYTNWSLNGNPETTKADGKITRTYEFRYKEIVKESGSDTKLPSLFTNVTVPDGVNNAEIAKLQDMTISIEAHAIQADGFATADLAWAEWE